MFSLSVFSTILLIIAACGAIVIFVFSIRSFLAKRSGDRFPKDDISSAFTFHLGKENDEIETDTQSVLKEIPGRLWEDLKHYLKKIFSKPDNDDVSSMYNNEEEHDILARIREEEGSDEYSMPSVQKEQSSAAAEDLSAVRKEQELSGNFKNNLEEKCAEEEKISEETNKENKQYAPKKTADRTEKKNSDLSIKGETSGSTDEDKQDKFPGPEDKPKNKTDKADTESGSTKKTKVFSSKKKKKAQEPDDLSYLFSLPEREEPAAAENNAAYAGTEKEEDKKVKTESSAENDDKLKKLRQEFLAGRKRNRKKNLPAKRKELKEGQPLSEEEQIFANSMLEDLIDDCDDLDKNKIKGRLSFLHRTLKKK